MEKKTNYDICIGNTYEFREFGSDEIQHVKITDIKFDGLYFVITFQDIDDRSMGATIYPEKLLQII